MADQKMLIGQVFPGHPQLSDALDQVWDQALRLFPGDSFEDWLNSCRSLSTAGLGAACILEYLRNGPTCAAIVGPEAAVELGRVGAALGKKAGGQATLAFLSAAPKVARRLAEPAAFRDWLRVMGRLVVLAPESIVPLMDRIEGVLAKLDVPGFEAWALGGVRAAGGHPENRLAFFTLADARARHWLQREADDVVFADVERRLKTYLMSLWGMRAPIRTPVAKGSEAVPRRASFDNGLIRMPESFRGFAGQKATDLFRASLAHIAAHLIFSGERMPVGSLRPIQVALVSLIEDARVEQLAIRRFPGLRRLWLPFHVAKPKGALIAPILMMRLARALIDPSYRDDNDWVTKGRRLFFDQEDSWEDRSISRGIGGLLGNDLGQMRIQFNAQTYIVEPPYRDDNMGLWDFGPDQQTEGMDSIFESVRMEREESDAEPPESEESEPEREPPTEAAKPVGADSDPEEMGVPVARYPEWDYAIGGERPEWTTIVEVPPAEGRVEVIDRVLERHPELVYRITSLIRSAKVSRPVNLRRQPEGDRLDLDACIEAAVSRRLSVTPDPRVYATSVRKNRDLSVLVLLDVSQSTNDIVLGGIFSVLSIERDAAALLAHAMSGLGDPFAIRAFCSNGREEVKYYRIKDFGAPYDAGAKSRLAGLTGELSTRIGAAIRHAGAELERQLSHRRLLLVITDGEPSDIDVADRKYLVEDARKAVASLAHEGIDVFCVGLDAGGDSYLNRIFGQRNVLVIDRLQRLPEKLPMLYFRLTA